MTGNIQNDHYLLTLLRSPVISEKATRVADKDNQIVFDVLPGASKEGIRAAVELIFKVEVESVQVLNRKGKVKRHRQIAGRCKATRKAYVRLKPGKVVKSDEKEYKNSKIITKFIENNMNGREKKKKRIGGNGRRRAQ